MDYNEINNTEVTTETAEPVNAEIVEAPERVCKAPIALLGIALVSGTIAAGGVWLFKKGKKAWQRRKARKAMEATAEECVSEPKVDSNESISIQE